MLAGRESSVNGNNIFVPLLVICPHIRQRGQTYFHELIFRSRMWEMIYKGNLPPYRTEVRQQLDSESQTRPQGWDWFTPHTLSGGGQTHTVQLPATVVCIDPPAPQDKDLNQVVSRCTQNTVRQKAIQKLLYVLLFIFCSKSKILTSTETIKFPLEWGQTYEDSHLNTNKRNTNILQIPDKKSTIVRGHFSCNMSQFMMILRYLWNLRPYWMQF